MKKFLIALITLSSFTSYAGCFGQQSDGAGLYRSGATGMGDIALGIGRGAREAAQIAFNNAENNAKECARQYCEDVTKRFCKNRTTVIFDGARRSQGSDTYVATAYAYAEVME